MIFQKHLYGALSKNGGNSFSCMRERIQLENNSIPFMAFDFFGSHFFCTFDDQFRFVSIV